LGDWLGVLIAIVYVALGMATAAVSILKTRGGVVQAGLATAHAERMVAGGKVTEVARLGITDEGRRVLATTARA
jgi:hypothetical protein